MNRTGLILLFVCSVCSVVSTLPLFASAQRSFRNSASGFSSFTANNRLRRAFRTQSYFVSIVSSSARLNLKLSRSSRFARFRITAFADRFFRRRYADAVNFCSRGQNENRHKTAFKTHTLVVNPKKLGAFYAAEPLSANQGLIMVNR